MNTKEQPTDLEVKVNQWVTIPITIMLVVNGVYNIFMGDWSETVLCALMLVIGLMFIEREKEVASLMIVNRTLQVSLLQVLEKIVKLKGEKDGRETEVSRD